jgi:hypothetical protein
MTNRSTQRGAGIPGQEGLLGPAPETFIGVRSYGAVSAASIPSVPFKNPRCFMGLFSIFGTLARAVTPVSRAPVIVLFS